jgi:hypothetical protein
MHIPVNTEFIDCLSVWITSFHNHSCVDTVTTLTLKTHNVKLIFSYVLLILDGNRLDGFYIYISDTFNEQHPNRGHQCYHDQKTGYPSTLQNITCDYPGRYLVIYNQRDNTEAFLELCEVEVYGRI